MVRPVEREKHFTIPLFIPHEACPFQCIFCNQESITGKVHSPAEEEIHAIVRRNLATFSPGAIVEAGFFGGTFTGLPAHVQEKYLRIIATYVAEGLISGIRLSTRPDFIDEEKLSLLARYPVKTIELGVQSFDDEVLQRSLRGHTAADSVRASRMITSKGFRLGLQMMAGLPGDSEEKVMKTAATIADLGAAEARIYPVIVIRGTALEKIYNAGKYLPLSLDEAVRWSASALEILESAGVVVTRVGLHHSDSLIHDDYLAGPAHPSFRELVTTELWNRRLMPLMQEKGGEVIISVHPEEVNHAIGYYGRNREMLLSRFSRVSFVQNKSIPLKNYHADYH